MAEKQGAGRVRITVHLRDISREQQTAFETAGLQQTPQHEKAIGVARTSEIHIESEILEVRPSKSKPDQGLIKARTTTLNQKDQPVQILIANLFVPRRSVG